MEHMKTVTIPAQQRDVVDRVTCDFCAKTIDKRGYEFSDVTIQINEGTRYPEGGTGTRTELDCCVGCWGSIVLPALRGLGAEPRTVDWDT